MSKEEKKTTGIVTALDILKEHKTGSKHFERAERILTPFSVIEQAKIPNIKVIEGQTATDEIIQLCHDKKYIEFLKSKASEATEESGNLYEDNFDMKISKGTEKAARMAAGSVITACDLVMSEQARNAFCLIRPPGHHAVKDKAMGFCFYNNIALGSKYLLSDKNSLSAKVKKVLIIDWDLHHGNGTQSFFQDDNNVFYFSFHLQGIFPNQPEEEKVENDTMLNVNIKSAITGMDEISQAFSKLEDKMESFKPDCIMISCGFDGHAEEKIIGGGFGLTDEDYMRLTKRVKKIAEKYCNGRIISVLEGGYNVEVLSRVILSHVQVLAE